MPQVALHVSLKAKPEKAGDLAAFLASAQPLAAAEPDTLTWYATRLSSDEFAIFDTFADEGGRQAHLQGPIAAALMAQADSLLAEPPVIHLADVLARK
jgi:quinol monooxygenase YgiN